MDKYGFIRVAACIPQLKVGIPSENAVEIIRQAKDASDKGVRIICFPEMCLTGATIGDTVENLQTLQGVIEALSYIREKSTGLKTILTIGLPLVFDGTLYDAFATICNGHILGITLCSCPTDQRHFQPVCHTGGTIHLCNEAITISDKLVFNFSGTTFTVQSSQQTVGPSADIILRPACYYDIAGRTNDLRRMVEQHSIDLNAAIILASTGNGESTTDNLYGGHAIIAEYGAIISENHFSDGLTIADIDIELLHHRKLRNRTISLKPYQEIFINEPIDDGKQDNGLYRPVNPAPFHYCDEVFSDTFRIQAESLATRLRHTGIKKVVLGVSGGLDSTLALLVCVKVFDQMGFDRKQITGITMPGFGTTDRTYSNAVGMMQSLGIDWREINIREASLLHLRDISHDVDIHDSAYENTQARERTQILMDVANETGALVVGTGDLSELALGWCTYNGDHMSMYAVNAGVPKTLIPGIIRYASESEQFLAAKANLLDVIDTPITPELLPSDSEGRIVQKTEDIIGPYELHDFFLYNMIVNGYAPSKILFIAKHAFAGKYSGDAIHKWLSLFIKRFYSNQFKRSCMPDGPAVSPVSLSPRCGWQMPSDISPEYLLDSLN